MAIFRFAALAALMCSSAVQAQEFPPIDFSSTKLGAVGVQPEPFDPDATIEETAQIADGHLTGKGYLNKPGADLAQYYREFQVCRLIVKRGDYYSAVSPAYTAAVGVLGSAFVAGAAERANRETCMFIKGWRKVRPSVQIGGRITTATGAGRTALLDRLLGEAEPKGKILEMWQDTVLPSGVVDLDAPVTGTTTMWAGKKVDPSVPIEIEDGDAVAVLAFRRSHSESSGQEGYLRLLRYDIDTGDLVRPPKYDSKQEREADSITYVVAFTGQERKAGYELQASKLTPGYYVIDVAGTGADVPGTHCFGAPLIEIEAGKATYIGDWVPLGEIELPNGDKLKHTLALTNKFEQARETLKTYQPAMAQELTPMAIGNGASYSCSGAGLSKWGIAGIADVPTIPLPRAEQDDY